MKTYNTFMSEFSSSEETITANQIIPEASSNFERQQDKKYENLLKNMKPEQMEYILHFEKWTGMTDVWEVSEVKKQRGVGIYKVFYYTDQTGDNETSTAVYLKRAGSKVAVSIGGKKRFDMDLEDLEGI